MKFQLNRLAASLALAAAGAAAALPVTANAAPAPSENATINLIRLLVQQGVLKPEQADALVAQAEAEAKAPAPRRRIAAPPWPRRATCACRTSRRPCATRSATRSRPK